MAELGSNLLLRSFEQLIYTQLVDQQDKVGIAITFYMLALRSSTLPISVACVQLMGHLAFPIHFQPVQIHTCLHSCITALPTITASQMLLHIGVAFMASNLNIG